MAPALTRDQAYDARPMAVAPVKRRPIEQDGVRLTVRLQPRGYQRWLLRMPENATRTIELDAAGVEVFDMCDGHTSVREIVRRFARNHQVDPQEAEVAVTTFIKSMLRRGLVSIAVPKR